MGENGLDSDVNKHDEATTSENHAETSTNGEKGDKTKQKEKADRVPFHRLFSFADSTDTLLMTVGTIGAIGNGMGLPLMTLLMGQMINTFGSNQSSTNIVDQVSKVKAGLIIKFISISIALRICSRNFDFLSEVTELTKEILNEFISICEFSENCRSL